MPCDFPSENFVGKVILYRSSAQELWLVARTAHSYEWWIESLRDAPSETILSEIAQLHSARGFDECFGYHREIPHSGKVLGGAIMLALDGVCYFNGKSQAYGPLPRGLTEQALKEYFGVESGKAPRWVLGDQIS